MAEDNKNDAPPKKKGKLLLIIIAVVLILALGSGAAYYFLVIQPAAAADKSADEEEEDPAPPKKVAASENDKETAESANTASSESTEAEPKKKKKKKKKKSDKDQPPAFINMEPFTVNLADTEQERFLQVTMVIQVAGEPAVEEFKKHMAMIRDTILKLLSSSKSTDIRSIEGKQKLSDGIIANVERAAHHNEIELPEIDKVFFTSFIIQ
jgi:flagellar FliL protein